MKQCIAIRHLQFEDLGTFAAPIAQAGYDITYLDASLACLNSAAQADLVVMLGGPIGAYDEGDYPFLTQEIHLAEQRIAQQRPTLGICLGAQIIARAAGARVCGGSAGKEIGWSPLTMTDAAQHSPVAALGSNDAQMFHWHGDTFDLPSDATLLASTGAYAHQIYAIGEAIMGLQCHPELAPERIEHWLVGHACEIASTDGVDAPSLRRNTQRYGAGLQQRATAFMEGWLAHGNHVNT